MQQDILPWVKQSFNGTYISHIYHPYLGAKNHTPNNPTKFVKQYLDDNPSMAYRKGDILKFNDGFFHRGFGDWREWFLTKRDQKIFWATNPAVAKWARNQLAIVIGRYRKVKFKYSTFIDYGVVTMLLTGPRVGHTRHYWSAKPFNIIRPFGRKLTKVLRKKLMPEVVDILDAPYEDTNESRNVLVSRLYYGLRGV